MRKNYKNLSSNLFLGMNGLIAAITLQIWLVMAQYDLSGQNLIFLYLNFCGMVKSI